MKNTTLKSLILFIFLLSLVSCATTGNERNGAGASGISYPENTTPLETDQMLGIDDPPGTWSIQRFGLSAIRVLFQGSALFSGDDLTVIGDVTAGSLSAAPGPDPAFTLFDSEAPGADPEVAQFAAQYIDGADGAENSDWFLRAMVAGTRTDIVQFDQSDNAVEFNTPTTLQPGDVASAELADTGAGAGSCTNCDITVNDKGQVTVIANGTGGTGVIGTVPTFRDTPPCSRGQYSYSIDGLTKFDCIDTDTWFTSTLVDSLSPAPVIPTLLSWTIQTNGTDSILVFSEAMTFDTGGSGGFATDTPTETLAYGSGDTTTTVTFTHPVINSTVTDNPLGDFFQPTDGWQSVSGSVELASFQDAAVDNLSEQTPAPAVTYIGWPNTDGTPIGIPASSYGAADNLVGNRWTATENGTISVIQVYVKTFTGTPVYEGVHVYKEITGTDTLIGKAAYTGSQNTWTGEVTPIVEGGQSLDFVIGDVITYGAAGNVSSDQYSIGRNDAGGGGMWFQSPGGVTAGGPPSTAVFSESAFREMGIIMGYTN